LLRKIILVKYLSTIQLLQNGLWLAKGGEEEEEEEEGKKGSINAPIDLLNINCQAS
jgi:hypothetical protein